MKKAGEAGTSLGAPISGAGWWFTWPRTFSTHHNEARTRGGGSCGAARRPFYPSSLKGVAHDEEVPARRLREPLTRHLTGETPKVLLRCSPKAHRRLNGQENRSDGQSPMGGENTDLAPSQPIDIVEAVCPFNQEQGPTRRRARSSKELHFEEYPPRQKKTDRCITYKLTDGGHINTGYGRTSRPLGYVMEIHPGRWIAMVGNSSSATLSLVAVKKAAIELYRSGISARYPKSPTTGGDPMPITWRWRRRSTARHWKLIASESSSCGPLICSAEPSGGSPASRSRKRTERLFLRMRNSRATRDLQGDYPLKYYDDGFPRLPECLRRATPKLVVNNPPRDTIKEEAA